jgi:hypothetical protein
MSTPKLEFHNTAAARELASRESNGLRVRLLWHPDADALTVSVDDVASGQHFQFPVERDRGLDAFHHPFACAAPWNFVPGGSERTTLALHEQG